MRNFKLWVLVASFTACVLSASQEPALAQNTMATIGVGQITSSIGGANPQNFQTMLETQLLNVNKFRMIERSRLEEILKEKGLGAAGITNGDKSISGVTGVDYLIYGTITKLGNQGQGIAFGGFATGSNKVQMAVDLRVVDAHTGEIKYANTVEEQASGGSSLAVGNFRTGGNAGDPLADVQRLTAKSIAAIITTSIYPVKVIAHQDDGTYVVNYGDSVLTNGDILKVFKVGQSFKDPDTGKVLGAEEDARQGLLKVSETTNSFSKATLVNGAANVGDTARRLSSSEAAKVSDTSRHGGLLP